MALKLRTKVNFPATVTAAGGLKVTKANGIWTVEPDFSQLAALTGSGVTDPSLKQVWLYDPTLLQYNVLTLSGLGNALYSTTSTTSLAIALGSQIFTVAGSGRDFAIGSFVIAVSAASSANYMVGQVTSYVGTLLVVNVTAIGGTGTHADWTITTSGPAGTLISPLRVVTAAGAVTVVSTDRTIIINKTVGAATTVNLPASPSTGLRFEIKDGKGDAATNNITITPAAGTIDGSATFVIDLNYASETVVYGGSEWSII